MALPLALVAALGIAAVLAGLATPETRRPSPPRLPEAAPPLP